MVILFNNSFIIKSVLNVINSFDHVSIHSLKVHQKRLKDKQN